MPIHDGDMVVFEYDLFIDGKMRESSSLERAGEGGVLQPGRVYRPILFTVGMAQIVPGLEVAIRDHPDVLAPEERPVRVTVPPEQAYGVRGSQLIETVPIQRFRNQKVNIGTQVSVDGRKGVVTRLGSGRVTIDFHHELAGHALEYEFRVLAVHTEPVPKVEATLRRALGDGIQPVWAKTEDVDTVTVATPFQVMRHPGWHNGRGQVVDQARFAYDGRRLSVVFVEAYEAPLPPPPKTEPAEPASAGGAEPAGTAS